MLLCFITRRILWNITPNTLSCTSVLLMTFLPSGVGPKGTLFEFLNALNSTREISTFQKPLNKYLYIPFESFHPSRNKKAFIKGGLMRYVRNSSSFNSFYETREKFWKQLRVKGYPFRFLLPLFREIRYTDRKKWLYKKPNFPQLWSRTC